MANGDADMIDTVIEGASEAKCAKDCQAHGPMLTVLHTVATSTHHTNATLKDVADLAEDTNVKVTALKDKMDSTRRLDPKDVLTWFRVLGAAAVILVLIMQAIQSHDDSKRSKALDVLLQLNGVDVTQIQRTSDMLTAEADKGRKP